MTQEVTERDLRLPEFKDAKLEDLEFRNDGKIVRKDRWETGIRKIAYATGFNSRSGFEIEEVIAKVEHHFAGETLWCAVSETEPEDWPSADEPIDIKIEDGSVIQKVTRQPDGTFKWLCGLVNKIQVTHWREHRENA